MSHDHNGGNGGSAARPTPAFLPNPQLELMREQIEGLSKDRGVLFHRIDNLTVDHQSIHTKMDDISAAILASGSHVDRIYDVCMKTRAEMTKTRQLAEAMDRRQTEALKAMREEQRLFLFQIRELHGIPTPMPSADDPSETDPD